MTTTTPTTTTNGNAPDSAVAAAEAELQELRARAAAVRERREAIEAGRERVDEIRKARDAVEREERALADVEALARAETEHGPDGVKIRAVDTPGGMVIVKRAGGASFRRFMDAKEATVDVAEKLVRPCVVHPSRAEFDRMVEEYPAVWTRLAGAITKLAGHRNDELTEK